MVPQFYLIECLLFECILFCLLKSFFHDLKEILDVKIMYGLLLCR